MTMRHTWPRTSGLCSGFPISAPLAIFAPTQQDGISDSCARQGRQPRPSGCRLPRLPQLTRGARGGRGRAPALLCLSVVLVAAAFWPWAGRYTSFGLDLERKDECGVRCDFVRLRWPGDGSVVACVETTHRLEASGPVVPWDLGARFLCDAPPVRADGLAERLGFHWVLHRPGDGEPPPIVAGSESALAVGVPHWFVIVVAAVLAQRLGRRARRITSSISDPADGIRATTTRTR